MRAGSRSILAIISLLYGKCVTSQILVAPLRGDQEQGAGVASDSCYTEASASSHMKRRCSLPPKNDSHRCRLGSGLMRVPPLGALLEPAELPSCVYMPTGVPLPMRGPRGLPDCPPLSLRPSVPAPMFSPLYTPAISLHPW